MSAYEVTVFDRDYFRIVDIEGNGTLARLRFSTTSLTGTQSSVAYLGFSLADAVIHVAGAPTLIDSVYWDQASVQLNPLEDMVVTFPDPALEQAVRWAIGDTLGGDIMLSDVLQIYYFNVGEKGVKDITGLETLSNLRFLYLDYNDFSDITPLSELSKLMLLSLEGNAIVDVEPLEHLNGLRRLNLSFNQIQDLTGIAYLQDLEELELPGNPGASFGIITHFRKLLRLDLAENQISDIAFLDGLTELLLLDLGDNDIADISVLEGLTNLSYLYLDNNSIANILPLVENTGLNAGDVIRLTGNPLDSVSVTEHIPALSQRGVTVIF
jgi:hypothetical protein